MKLRQIIAAGLIATLIAACDRNGDSYIVGHVLTDPSSTIGYTDTFNLKMSTVRLDSFNTSGYDVIHMGYYKDTMAGNVRTETYIPLTYYSRPEFNSETIFDSIVLVVKPNGNWSGDTLLPKTFSIYEVAADIEPNPNNEQPFNLFNNQSIPYKPTPLGKMTVTPSPKGKLVSYCRLSDSLGQSWVDMLNNNDENIESASKFEVFFKGIMIRPETDNVSWGMDFVTVSNKLETGKQIVDAENFEIRLYYRTPEDGEDDSYMVFRPEKRTYMFTHFIREDQGTVFENLDIDGDFIPSEQSNNVSVIQAGSGLALRIEIPSLTKLHDVTDYINMLDARLTIRPKENSFNDTYKLPKELYVAITDQSNELLSNLTDMSGARVVGRLTYADNFDEDPYYVFSVSAFIRSRMLHPSDDYNALLILASDQESSTSFFRLLVDDKTTFGDNVQLQVYYTTYLKPDKCED